MVLYAVVLNAVVLYAVVLYAVVLYAVVLYAVVAKSFSYKNKETVMTDYKQSFAATEIEGGVLTGPFRQARNMASNIEGGIHTDSEAQKLGMRGGVVAGSVHFDQFPPLLTEVLGRNWLQTGGLSLYFRYPTQDLEAVQCFARRPDVDPSKNDVQTDVWIMHENGEKVAEGTASVGAPDMNSTVKKRVASVPEAKDIRIFADLEVGRQASDVSCRIEKEAMGGLLQTITEPMPAYSDEHIWGKRIASPSSIISALQSVQGGLLDSDSWRTGTGDYGVRLYGSIELQAYKGPVFQEKDYQIHGSILAIGETPKTEYFWFDSILVDPDTGDDIISMIMMIRSMKASHEAWQ